MKKHRVGVIGTGLMGRNHIRVLSSLEAFEVVAVCDSDPAKAISGPWLSMCDYREMKHQELDYCVVATPTLSHEQICLDLIESGHSILVEKPLSNSVESAMRICQAQAANNSHMAVGMIERFNGASLEAKRIIASGVAGKLIRVATRRVGPAPRRETGVGVVLDLCTHDLDLVTWMTDDRFATVEAQLVSGVKTKYEDFALLTGSMVSGTLIQIEASWLSPIKERSIELLFENGLVRLNLLTGEVRFIEQVDAVVGWPAGLEMLGSASFRSETSRVKTVEPLVAEHSALGTAVQLGDWSKLPGTAEAVMVLEVVESIRR